MQAKSILPRRVRTALVVLATSASFALTGSALANATAGKEQAPAQVSKPEPRPANTKVAQATRVQKVRKVEFTGSRIPQNLRDDKPLWTMSPVSVIDASAISRSGRTTVAGVISSQVPGAFGR